MSDILQEKKTNVIIYKKNQGPDKLILSSLQYLFCGFTEKIKIEIHFDLGNKINKILLKKEEELTIFISKWRTKISIKLNIDKNDILMINPKDNNNLCSLDLISNEINNNNATDIINKLKDFEEIKDLNQKPFLEGCQLSTVIFDPKWNNLNGDWGIGEKRGGEDFIPPIEWEGYGLNVSGKYDDGDDTWLDYRDKEGVFAIAYFGLSNIYGNKVNSFQFLNEINSNEALKKGYDQIYKNDDDLRNPGKKCGCGVLLFQNPKIAENTAGIFDIYGIRYKLLLMCRVNPKKIRQPRGFKDCWILNPSPSEIRPYRILIKKVFQTPLARDSQNEIMIFDKPSQRYLDIIKEKNNTFLNQNNTPLSDFDYALKLYTTSAHFCVNNYLREGKIAEDETYSEEEIKSFIYCLHDALTSRKSNVNNSSICYRGVGKQFIYEIKIGEYLFLENLFQLLKI